MMKKPALILLSLALAVALSACGKKETTGAGSSASVSPGTSASVSPSASAGVSPSKSPGTSANVSPSASASVSPSKSPSASASVSPSASASVSPSKSPSPSAGASTNASASPAATTVAANADPEALFKANCVSCHGADLTGKIGPDLTKVGGKLSVDQIKKQISSGGGKMPAMSKLKEEEVTALATWLSAKK